MRKCGNCEAEQYRVESNFCGKCGGELSECSAPMQNICMNEDCDWHKTEFIYPDDARFCDVCGNKTAYAE